MAEQVQEAEWANHLAFTYIKVESSRAWIMLRLFIFSCVPVQGVI